MTNWLIYPPFADPTQPYLSLAYLKGCLRAKGMDATVVDMNVAAAHYLLGRKHVEESAQKLANRFEALNRRKKLTSIEEMEYVFVADARSAARRLLSAGSLPVEIFQDPKRFYDPVIYRNARDLAEDALALTSADSFPFCFHFNQAAHAAVPWGPELLENYFQNRQSPLDDFYRTFLKGLSLTAGDVVGVNLTFVSQIPEAFYLAQLLRRIEPSLFIVLGGSCLQQMLAHGTDSARRWVVQVADAACLFEGEETLPMLLSILNDGKGRNPDQIREELRKIPNLLTAGSQGDQAHAGPLQVTDLSSLTAPDYSDLDLDGYLAPERTLLFAPTRGCYWNRCAFCDYGLNRSKCHDYREMAAQEAAWQLTQLSRRYNVRNFYLSVDVMAPRFALDLAHALLDQKADIRWSADFRMEKYYSAERCKILYQSGLRAAAFGVESGSGRMLKRMDKGITPALIREVNACFHQAGIATAWMTFSGHPGETGADALETARLIEQEQKAVSLFIMGRFGLTSGALIAGQPEKYGLRRVFYCRGDAFHLFPLHESAQPLQADAAERKVEAAVARLSGNYLLDHYPWAGAISTHHSLLYVLKHGPQFFQKIARAPQKRSGKRGGRKQHPDLPSGLTMPPKFSVERLRDKQQRVMHAFWQHALAIGRDGLAPLDHDYFMNFFEIHFVGKSIDTLLL